MRKVICWICKRCNGRNSASCKTCWGHNTIKVCVECNEKQPTATFTRGRNGENNSYCDNCIQGFVPCARCNTYPPLVEFRIVKGKRNKSCNDCLETQKRYDSKVEKNCCHGILKRKCVHCKHCPPLNASPCAWCGKWYDRWCMYERTLNSMTSEDCQCQHCLWCLDELNDKEDLDEMCRVCNKSLAKLVELFNDSKMKQHSWECSGRLLTENQWSWLNQGRPEQEHYTPTEEFLAFRANKRRRLEGDTFETKEE